MFAYICARVLQASCVSMCTSYCVSMCTWGRGDPSMYNCSYPQKEQCCFDETGDPSSDPGLACGPAISVLLPSLSTWYASLLLSCLHCWGCSVVHRLVGLVVKDVCFESSRPRVRVPLSPWGFFWVESYQ